MLSLIAGLALAGPLDGWEDSRWLIEVEETLPIQLSILGPDTNPVVVRALQVEAVLHCPDFEMAGKKAAYVGCKFEQMALRASPQSNPGPRLDQYQSALAAFESALEGGKAELKIKDDGKVAQTDFESPPKTDEWAVLAARAITNDLLSGFSLQRADVPAGSAWDEKNSPIVRAATQPLGNGQTKIRHQPISQDGMNVLQSTGEGSFSSMYISWGAGSPDGGRGSVAANSAYSAVTQTGVFPTRLFDATFNSVVVEGETGPFQERIWSLQSSPKMDRLYNTTGQAETPVWTTGHIRRMKDGEKVELGSSGLTSAPGAKFGDLPDWTPMEGLGG